jgi:hypothetical protein
MLTATKPNTTQSRPRRAPVAPGDDTGDFTLAAIGRRLHRLGQRYNELDRQQLTCREHTAEYRHLNAAMGLLLEEEIALPQLVMAMQPKTLEDTTVQVAVLFMTLNRMGAFDLRIEMESGRLGVELERVERAAACATAAMCRLTGIQTEEAGGYGLGNMLSFHVPPHVQPAMEGEAAA